jgi:preprotein translocase subunit YajC
MSWKQIAEKINFLNFFAFCIMGACIFYFFWISGTSKQEENRNIGEIKTAMIALVMLIANYFFGSSKSSSKKDETIQQMTDTANNNSKK